MKELSQGVLDKIDLYLSDGMNSLEKTEFETQIASNPDLKEEVEFQKDVIQSIRQREVSRIKSNLNNVSVSLTSKFLQTPAIMSYVFAGLVGFGTFAIYSYFENDNNPFKTAQVVAINEGHEDYYNENTTVASAREDEVVVEDAALTQIQERRTEENSAREETEIGESGTPVLVSVDDNDSEEGFKTRDVEVGENPATSVKTMSGKKVDVEIKRTRSKKVEYQFYDDKLYLYGNFSEEEPYVIYDIPTNYGTEYYFKIAENYYRIQPNQVDRKELEPVTNTEIIKELEKK